MTLVTNDNRYTEAKWIVDASLGRGTHQTIAAAIAEATSGDTIFIRPGTYTENLTLKAGVNLCAFGGDQVTTIIVGKLSASYSGTVEVYGLGLQTNADYIAEITGANSTVLNFRRCLLSLEDNTGFSDTGSGSSSFRFESCTINANTTGIGYFASTNGVLFLTNCIMNNLGGGTTASTFSGTGVFIRWCFLGLPVTVSGTAKIEALASQWDTTNATALNIDSTATGNIVNYCYLNTGTATPIAIGTGATLTTPVVNLRHSNATAVSGLGTLVHGTINQSSTVGAISPSAVTTKATNLGELKLNTGATINEFSTDGTLAGNSDTAVPTEKAVKTYVDGAVSGAGAWELISSATASASANISFTNLTSAYEVYEVVIHDFVPATDGSTLIMRTSSNNGVSYDSGASDYAWQGLYKNNGTATAGVVADNADSGILIFSSAGAAANETSSGTVRIYKPSTATYTKVFHESANTNNNGEITCQIVAGVRFAASAVDAIQFLMTAGNIASGTFKLYGLVAS